MSGPLRSRRSTLAVPGSSPKMLGKAPGLPADEVFLVRVNDLATAWTYRDVIEVVEAAGANLDGIILPKVESAAQVQWLDLLLTQVEKTAGLPVGGIAIEAQIESAAPP